jgi:hypothetical protein
MRSAFSLQKAHYRTLNAELFVNQEPDNNDYVGGMFRHLSSRRNNWCGARRSVYRFIYRLMGLIIIICLGMDLGYKTKSITGTDYQKILVLL